MGLHSEWLDLAIHARDHPPTMHLQLARFGYPRTHPPIHAILPASRVVRVEDKTAGEGVGAQNLIPSCGHMVQDAIMQSANPKQMITQNWLEVGPAYGRDYKSAKAAKKDWVDGLDFKMLSVIHGVDCHGTYCSRSDFQPGTSVILRYAKMTKTAIAVA